MVVACRRFTIERSRLAVGERLDVESVRSSIARRLGVDIGVLAPVDRHVEGVVESADHFGALQQLSHEQLHPQPVVHVAAQVLAALHVSAKRSRPNVTSP